MMSVSRLIPKLVSFLCCNWSSEYIPVHARMYVYAYLAIVNVGYVYRCNAGCMCTLQTLMKGVYTLVHSKCDH